MKPLIQFRKTSPLYVILVTIVWPAVLCLPKVFGIVPPPDGGYPNFTTAEGQNALFSLTSGVANTAVGWFSLNSVTTGSFNTGVGAAALTLNGADQNTAVGAGALLLNTTGTNNTAHGAFALLYNDMGNDNNAVGAFALFSNTSGGFNNAVGQQALASNETGAQNNALGDAALQNNVDGTSNTALGDDALVSNVTGDSNTAVGDETLAASTGDKNTAVGAQALDNKTAGNENTAVGFQAGALIDSGDGNVCIGANVLGSGAENNFTRIRNIGSTPIISSTNIVIAGIGGIGDEPLGYAASSQRYKQDIKPMDKASETLFALNPVSYRAKQGVEPGGVKLYGLIAEDVATVDPDLVIYNEKGQPETLRFDSINAMLLNEFIKDHKRVEEMKCEFQVTVARQQKEIDSLTAQLKEQALLIQKVNARFSVGRAVPRFAVDGNHK